MAYQIGTDEAGYGPNLGPLMISGTRWIVPHEDIELYELLSKTVCNQPKDKSRIAICDSKALYKSSGTIANLERSVLSLLFGAFGVLPTSLAELESLLKCEVNFSPEKLFRNCKSEVALPLAANPSEIELLGLQFREDCESNSVALDQFVCKAIFPKQFNALIESCGNKAELLSTQSIDIVHQLLQACDSNVRVICDRHGGRSKYLGLINQYLSGDYVTIECEQKDVSGYSWQRGGSSVALEFRTGGESFLPTALSSMIAKYVRELTMHVWNQFWALKVPGIKPTKGYPVDARRFHSEIVAAQRKLKIDDQLIWRSR